MSQLSTVELAEKQRYLHLLIKVKEGKHLTNAELKELKNYEAEMTKKKIKPAKKQKKTKRKKKTAAGKLSAAKIKFLALNYDNMTEAGASLESGKSLAFALKKNKKYKKAWKRGRFLRKLGQLAETAATTAEAERALELDTGELSKLLGKNGEIADLWHSKRLSLIIELKKSLVKSAMEGKAAAIKNIEKILRNELKGRHQGDYHNVTIGEMIELTGRTRQTIHSWYTKYGLQRNSDKTFDLGVFITWLESFIAQKLSNSPKTAFSDDPLKEAKAEKLHLDMNRVKGSLLERQQVMAGLLARQQNLINNLNDNKADEIASSCENKQAGKIAEILKTFFADVLRLQCHIPEQLRLSKEAAVKFCGLLSEIKAEG